MKTNIVSIVSNIAAVIGFGIILCSVDITIVIAKEKKHKAFLEWTNDPSVRQVMYKGYPLWVKFIRFKSNLVYVENEHKKTAKISPQDLHQDDIEWYQMLLHPIEVEDPYRKEFMIRVRMARAAASKAKRQASFRAGINVLNARAAKTQYDFRRIYGRGHHH